MRDSPPPTQPPRPPASRPLLSIIQVHRQLGIPRAMAYAAAASGELKTIQHRSRQYTTERWVAAWLNGDT
ncbi:hypothetical protein [Deinococcus gobiensis]|nr:hypothetical protein [Deinococcus gobiensis]